MAAGARLCTHLVRRSIAAVVLLLAWTGGARAGDILDVPATFSVPRSPLEDALRVVAKQADLQILFSPALVSGHSAPALSGTLAPREALARLLEGTGLVAQEQGPGVIVVRERQTAGAREGPTAPPAASPVPGAVVPGRGSEIEEVVVTAQRRAERLQDVPISVAVHTRASLDAQGARSMDDLARLTPGTSFSRGGATNNNSESSTIAIRGIVSDAGAATTGVYIDDTPIQSRHLSFPSFNTYPVLFDVERVEVLRGPQGTLFGSGSEGGTVRFITPEPVLDRSTAYLRSEVAVTAHGDPIYEAGGAAGGPLVADRAGIRASVSWRHEGGYIDRLDWHTRTVLESGANASRTVTARLAVKWLAGPHLALTPSVAFQQRASDDTAAWWSLRPGDPDPTAGQFAAPFRNGNAIAQPSSDRFVLPALKVEWALRGATLVSSTSYFRRQQSAVTDYTQFDRAIFLGSPYASGAPGTGTGFWADNQKNWTEEIRLESAHAPARIRWTAGVFLQRAEETTSHRVYDPAVQAAAFGLPPQASGGFIYIEDPRLGIDRQVAVYGQVEARLARHLTATVGLRVASAGFDGAASYPATLVVGPAVASAGTQHEHPLTPRFGVHYAPDGDHLVYATAAKGFRIGGVNAHLGQFCGLAAPSSFSSDSLWSYELGTKNTFAAGRLLLNASAYYVTWNNIQQNVGLACGFQYAANLGEAVSRGLDLKVQVRPTAFVTAGLTVAYTDAHYTRSVSQAAVGFIVQDGDHLPVSPVNLAAFGEAVFTAFGREGYVHADYEYSARQADAVPEQDPRNDGAYTQGTPGIPAQSYASLRAGLRCAGLDVSLFAQNLFDTRPKLTAYNDVGGAQGGTPLYYVITWRPRTVGVTATFHY